MSRFDQQKITRLVASAVGVLILLACADNPVSPHALAKRPLQAARSLSYTNYNTSEITIVDDADGTTYTLNAANREIRVSDGSYIELDSAQTEAFAAEFQGTVETDPIMPAMSNLSLNPPACETYSVNDKPPRCVEDMRALVPGAVALTMQVPMPSSGGPRAPATVLLRRGSTERAIAYPYDTGTAPLPGIGTVASLDYATDPCVDILNAATNNAADLNSHRTTFLQDIKAGVTGALVSRAGEWVIEKTLTAAEAGVAAAVATEVAERAQARIALGVLAFSWNTYQCGTHVPVAQITFQPASGTGAGGSTGSGGNLVCQNETWQISFDGGQHWSDIVVKACRYVAMQ